MRVAAVQFDVRRGESATNLSAVEDGLRAAARAGVELVVLPELWASGFPGPQSDLGELLAADARSWERVSTLSRELGIAVAGSAFGAVAGSLPRNRARLFERGTCLLEHDKVHLFSPTAEPESFSAGDAPLGAALLRGARVGLAICYDLRFPELTRTAFLAGVEVLCVSAQWPLARSAHWDALVRGLAVQNQCLVIACNRTGTDVIGRRELVLEFPGNSAVVSPDGELLAAGRPEDALVAAEFDLALVRELRRRVPVERDRRAELYARWSGDQRAP
ncbi:MAG: carbon-nitrogen family hydrolase [Planctomycetes bacterium]|nr:carbon-nitrogen family hydrolase [Planctomycetota bacterium]